EHLRRREEARETEGPEREDDRAAEEHDAEHGEEAAIPRALGEEAGDGGGEREGREVAARRAGEERRAGRTPCEDREARDALGEVERLRQETAPPAQGRAGEEHGEGLAGDRHGREG